MKVEIYNNSTDPANSILHCHELKSLRAFCSIYEEDFIELLTDDQYKLLEKGRTIFNIDKQELLMKSKSVFHSI